MIPTFSQMESLAGAVSCGVLLDWGYNSYRDELYSLQILLSRTQAGPGKTVNQEQEEISPNHVKRLNLIFVLGFREAFHHIRIWKRFWDPSEIGQICYLGNIHFASWKPCWTKMVTTALNNVAVFRLATFKRAHKILVGNQWGKRRRRGCWVRNWSDSVLWETEESGVFKHAWLIIRAWRNRRQKCLLFVKAQCFSDNMLLTPEPNFSGPCLVFYRWYEKYTVYLFQPILHTITNSSAKITFSLQHGYFPSDLHCTVVSIDHQVDVVHACGAPPCRANVCLPSHLLCLNPPFVSCIEMDEKRLHFRFLWGLFSVGLDWTLPPSLRRHSCHIVKRSGIQLLFCIELKQLELGLVVSFRHRRLLSRETREVYKWLALLLHN